MGTPRQVIKELLLAETLSSLQLSRLLSLPEKEVLDHLAHIARAPGVGHQFQIMPAACRHCGFVFRKRDRLSIPSRCPICHHEAISRPRFTLVKK
jgi:predicted Zn-ribbon and HTH transcriptional regulator